MLPSSPGGVGQQQQAGNESGGGSHKSGSSSLSDGSTRDQEEENFESYGDNEDVPYDRYGWAQSRKSSLPTIIRIQSFFGFLFFQLSGIVSGFMTILITMSCLPKCLM